jgi:hypothetical protein
VDVTEVGLQPMTGRVVQGDEGLAAVEPLLLQVAADLIVAAGIAVLGLQPAEQLGSGVPLLPRGGRVGDEDRVHDSPELPEDRCGSGLLQPVGYWLRLVQGLEDGLG